MADTDLFADIPTTAQFKPGTGAAPARVPTAPKVKPDLFADIPHEPGAGDLLMTGVKKFPGSFGKLVGNTLDSLWPESWPGQFRAMSSVVRGGLENVRNISPPASRGTQPPMATPQERLAATAAGDQVKQAYTHPLKAFAEDPASELSMLSIPVTMGGSALEAAPIGALQTAGKVASVTGDLMNPMGLAIRGATTGPKLVGKMMPKGTPPEVLAAQRARHVAAGVDPSFATTGGPLTQATAEFTSKGPLSVPARANLATTVEQTGDAAAKVAGLYGTPTTRSLAGETLQTGIKRYVGDEATPGSFKAKVAKLYDDAFTPIQKGEDAAVAASEAEQAKAAGELSAKHAQAVEDAKAAQAGEQLAAEQGMSVPEDQRTVIPPAPEKPAAAPTTTTATTQGALEEIKGSINSESIRKVIQDPRIPAILDALQNDPASIRFADLRQLRTWVRNAQGNPDLILGVGQGNLQRLESALTDDLYVNAQTFGGDTALNKLKKTDDYYRKGMDRIQTALQPFADKASGEGAFDRLKAVASSGAQADVNSLFRLKRSLQPGDWGDIQASLIQNAGRGPTGEGPFSPTQFVDWYSKLPEKSKDVLFGAMGTASKSKPYDALLRSRLDNLVSVAGDVSKVEKMANPGALGHWQLGTAGLTMMGGFGTALLGNPGAAFATIATELTALVGESAVAQLLTSPKALNWITKFSSATSKGGDASSSLMKNLARVAKTDAQLQPVYQAANNVLNPQKKPAEAGPAFDPTQMTEEELRAHGGAPEATTLAPDADRAAFIKGLSAKEAMALTMAGEASNDPHEMAAVGHVIQNRLAKPEKYGSDMVDVLKPEEFNAWENTAALEKLKGTPKYEQALSIADDILAGKHADNTNGSTRFYAPKALSELHKTQPAKYPHERPEWAKGDGLPLGQSVFYP